MSFRRNSVSSFFFFSTMLLLAEPALAGPIYVYKEASGSIRFSDKAPPSGVRAEVFTAKGVSYSILGGSVRRGEGKLFPNHYSTLIDLAAGEHGVEPSLIRALIHTESAFNPRAVSPKGARGLMQLMPEVARMRGVKNSFDPEQNISGGTRHLALLIKRYSGNLKLALAAYNAGEGAVEQYGGIPPYRETQEYVRRVLALMTRYSARHTAKP
ncbi:MAG: lytic transglycosylase domain-containing protein [Deltaproteobacteria bacterium]|nr:lytic transglycosylase domain-containing protein [Deltaproteobacteria bacterium]